MTQTLQPSTCQRPVVLVHGLWNTVDIFWRLRSHLAQFNRPVYGLSMAPNNGDIGIDEQAHQLKAYIESALPPEQSFDLVGFSMGGLVSRYYLQRLNGLNRVQRFVTIATPHYGSAMAWGRWNIGGRQLRPGSKFLRDLNQDLYTLESLNITTIWTPWDLLVVPATSCRLPIGTPRRVLTPSHNSLLTQPAALEAISSALS
ncbi:MAG: alpha/beta fold hydrolase [Cyanobacteria bacterium J06632_3]